MSAYGSFRTEAQSAGLDRTFSIHRTWLLALTLTIRALSQISRMSLRLDSNLSRHLLLLDGAVDRHVSDVLFRHREDGSWAGVAVATDESPPKQPCFRGFRFQLTVMYLGIMPPVVEWESSALPPLQ